MSQRRVLPSLRRIWLYAALDLVVAIGLARSGEVGAEEVELSISDFAAIEKAKKLKYPGRALNDWHKVTLRIMCRPPTPDARVPWSI